MNKCLNIPVSNIPNPECKDFTPPQQLPDIINLNDRYTWSFKNEEYVLSGADFSEDRSHRYRLYRFWDARRPTALFIGLNPSTADETEPDPTIMSVENIARFNGYGGFFMMNCWSFISTDPKKIQVNSASLKWNDDMITVTAASCRDVVFAWGNFDVVSKYGRDTELKKMFTNALCIGKNANGSPKHPLFQRAKSKLIKF